MVVYMAIIGPGNSQTVRSRLMSRRTRTDFGTRPSSRTPQRQRPFPAQPLTEFEGSGQSTGRLRGPDKTSRSSHTKKSKNATQPLAYVLRGEAGKPGPGGEISEESTGRATGRSTQHQMKHLWATKVSRRYEFFGGTNRKSPFSGSWIRENSDR